MDVRWDELSDIGPDLADITERLAGIQVHLVSDEVLFAVQEGPLGHLADARDESQGFGDRKLRISITERSQLLGVGFKHWKDVLIDCLELLDCVFGRGLHYLLRLRDSDLSEVYAGLLLNPGHLVLLLLRPESNASAEVSGASCPARAVYVCLCVVWRLDLDHQVYVRDVQAPGGDVRSDKDRELLLLESLQGDFTLVLGDVSVHDLDIPLQLIVRQ